MCYNVDGNMYKGEINFIMGKMKDLFIDELMMAEWTWNGQPCPESYKQAYHDLHFLSFTFSDIEKSYERLLNRINNIEIKSKRKELFKLAKK